MLSKKKPTQLTNNKIDYSFSDIASIIKKLIIRKYLMKIEKLKDGINHIWEKKKIKKKILKKRYKYYNGNY